MIRLTINLDILLTNRECTGDYELSKPEPSDEDALKAVQAELKRQGKCRFLEDWGLIDVLDIEAQLHRPTKSDPG